MVKKKFEPRKFVCQSLSRTSRNKTDLYNKAWKSPRKAWIRNIWQLSSENKCTQENYPPVGKISQKLSNWNILKLHKNMYWVFYFPQCTCKLEFDYPERQQLGNSKFQILDRHLWLPWLCCLKFSRVQASFCSPPPELTALLLQISVYFILYERLH